MDINKLLCGKECECGKTHTCDIDYVYIENNAILRLTEILRDYKSVLIVAHSGVSKAFSGYFDGIQDGKFLKRGLKNCEIKEYEL